jgi:hypothetical protein
MGHLGIAKIAYVVDWAELVTLDLSLWDKSGGKAKLASQLEHAVHHVGKAATHFTMEEPFI